MPSPVPVVSAAAVAPPPSSSCISLLSVGGSRSPHKTSGASTRAPGAARECECCHRDHNGGYGSGRFCSVHCARRVAASRKWAKRRQSVHFANSETGAQTVDSSSSKAHKRHRSRAASPDPNCSLLSLPGVSSRGSPPAPPYAAASPVRCVRPKTAPPADGPSHSTPRDASRQRPLRAAAASPPPRRTPTASPSRTRGPGAPVFAVSPTTPALGGPAASHGRRPAVAAASLAAGGWRSLAWGPAGIARPLPVRPLGAYAPLGGGAPGCSPAAAAAAAAASSPSLPVASPAASVAAAFGAHRPLPPPPPLRMPPPAPPRAAGPYAPPATGLSYAPTPYSLWMPSVRMVPAAAPPVAPPPDEAGWWCMVPPYAPPHLTVPVWAGAAVAPRPEVLMPKAAAAVVIVATRQQQLRREAEAARRVVSAPPTVGRAHAPAPAPAVPAGPVKTEAPAGGAADGGRWVAPEADDKVQSEGGEDADAERSSTELAAAVLLGLSQGGPRARGRHT